MYLSSYLYSCITDIAVTMAVPAFFPAVVRLLVVVPVVGPATVVLGVDGVPVMIMPAVVSSPVVMVSSVALVGPLVVVELVNGLPVVAGTSDISCCFRIRTFIKFLTYFEHETLCQHSEVFNRCVDTASVLVCYHSLFNQDIQNVQQTCFWKNLMRQDYFPALPSRSNSINGN